MIWRFAFALALTAMALPEVVAPQSKAQHYNARIIVETTSVETYVFARDAGKEHQKSTGTATIATTYSQDFQLGVQSGTISVAKPLGPASSSVNAAVTADQTIASGNDSLRYTEAFGTNPHSGNDADEGTGTSSAGVLDDFGVDGSGLGFRIETQAQLKGKCTTNNPQAAKACLTGEPFQQISVSSAPNTSAHTDAAPQIMPLTLKFDVNSATDSESCASCLSGAQVKGNLSSGYFLTYDNTQKSEDGGWKRTWHVTVKAKIAILGPG